MSLQQPLTSFKLTNVAVVRLKKGGKRFELACYKNKVLEWRNEVEKDLDNVLQIDMVFTNVSKGQTANKEELMKCFGTGEPRAIVLEILRKGEVQVGEKERASHQESAIKEIAQIVADKTLNPETKKPYTRTIIEKAMVDIHYSVHPTKNSKQQALEVIKVLQEKAIIPLIRTQMRIKVCMASQEARKIKAALFAFFESVEEEEWDMNFEATCLIDPGSYREICTLISDKTKGKGAVQVLQTGG